VIPYSTIFIIVALAIFSYWIGEADYKRGFMVGGISVAVSLVTLFLLQWGLLGNLGAQAGLLAALFAINFFRKRH
jgi:hypothetical protein